MTEKLLRDTLKEAQEKGHYEGPITLVPLNEFSKSF